jgi:LmbE family N-acetylglucosaminyl deacetylase
VPTDLSRRGLLGAAGLFALGPGLPLAAWAEEEGKRLRVVVAGAHPDDPETGAGGTLARYSLLHHEVVCLYLTRGEAGIPGKSHEQAARIRTAEAENACRILRTRPIFAGQIDGASEVNAARYDEFHNLLEGLQPDIVFTHFPVDTHRDHRAISLLVLDSWQSARRKFLLYYFEVMTGEQTRNFQPTDYVDITATEPAKRKACLAHESQQPAEMYAYHERMSRFRGMECGVEHAEAFISYALNGRAGAVIDGL